MASVTYTFTPNTKAKAAEVNQNFQDLATALTTVENTLNNPIRCRAYRATSAQSLNSGTTTAIQLNGETYDTDTMHSTSTNNTRITFNTAGTYVVTANLRFAANATGLRAVNVRLNGGSTNLVQVNGAPTPTSIWTGVASCTHTFTAGDYIEMTGLQASGGALNVDFGEYDTHMEVCKIA